MCVCVFAVHPRRFEELENERRCTTHKQTYKALYNKEREREKLVQIEFGNGSMCLHSYINLDLHANTNARTHEKVWIQQILRAYRTCKQARNENYHTWITKLSFHVKMVIRLVRVRVWVCSFYFFHSPFELNPMGSSWFLRQQDFAYQICIR